jgi:hypothetical protein
MVGWGKEQSIIVISLKKSKKLQVAPEKETVGIFYLDADSLNLFKLSFECNVLIYRLYFYKNAYVFVNEKQLYRLLCHCS